VIPGRRVGAARVPTLDSGPVAGFWPPVPRPAHRPQAQHPRPWAPSFGRRPRWGTASPSRPTKGLTSTSTSPPSQSARSGSGRGSDRVGRRRERHAARGADLRWRDARPPALLTPGGAQPTCRRDLCSLSRSTASLVAGAARRRAGAGELAPIATRLGLGLVETAAGAVRVVGTDGRSLRKATCRRATTRDCVVFAYGGAGPVHAARYARELARKVCRARSRPLPCGRRSARLRTCCTSTRPSTSSLFLSRSDPARVSRTSRAGRARPPQ